MDSQESAISSPPYFMFPAAGGAGKHSHAFTIDPSLLELSHSYFPNNISMTGPCPPLSLSRTASVDSSTTLLTPGGNIQIDVPCFPDGPFIFNQPIPSITLVPDSPPLYTQDRFIKGMKPFLGAERADFLVDKDSIILDSPDLLMTPKANPRRNQLQSLNLCTGSVTPKPRQRGSNAFGPPALLQLPSLKVEETIHGSLSGLVLGWIPLPGKEFPLVDIKFPVKQPTPQSQPVDLNDHIQALGGMRLADISVAGTNTSPKRNNPGKSMRTGPYKGKGRMLTKTESLDTPSSPYKSEKMNSRRLKPSISMPASLPPVPKEESSEPSLDSTTLQAAAQLTLAQLLQEHHALHPVISCKKSTSISAKTGRRVVALPTRLTRSRTRPNLHTLLTPDLAKAIIKRCSRLSISDVETAVKNDGRLEFGMGAFVNAGNPQARSDAVAQIAPPSELKSEGEASAIGSGLPLAIAVPVPVFMNRSNRDVGLDTSRSNKLVAARSMLVPAHGRLGEKTSEFNYSVPPCPPSKASSTPGSTLDLSSPQSILRGVKRAASPDCGDGFDGTSKRVRFVISPGTNV